MPMLIQEHLLQQSLKLDTGVSNQYFAMPVSRSTHRSDILLPSSPCYMRTKCRADEYQAFLQDRSSTRQVKISRLKGSRMVETEQPAKRRPLSLQASSEADIARIPRHLMAELLID